MLLKFKNKFSNKQHAFKLYTLLCVLFIILQIECILFITKQISIFNIDLTISGITYPFNLLILGVITNCYGYQYARQLLWLNNLVILQFIAYSFFVGHIHPSHMMEATQSNVILSYNTLIPMYIKSAISGIFSENIGNFVFIWLVNKSKIVQDGKKIGWRIIKYSILANLIMISISYSMIFKAYTLTHIAILISNVMFVKIIIELLFIKLTVYCATKLRKYEGVEVFDTSTYNPFALLIKHEYLNVIENLKVENESRAN